MTQRDLPRLMRDTLGGSRAVVASRLVLYVALLAALITLGGGQALGMDVSETATHPSRANLHHLPHNILKCFRCIYERAGYGLMEFEAAAWITYDGEAFDCVFWEQSRRQRRTTWSGRMPEGVVALAHTHPLRSSPEPSRVDVASADRLGIPVYVVNRNSVTVYSPDTRDITRVLSRKAWRRGLDSEGRKQACEDLSGRPA